MRQKTLSKRNEFLRVGKEMFFEKGYINVSVKEICDKLNTTTGSFYFMFSSKEKLLEELLLEDLNHLWTIGEKACSSKKDLKNKLSDYFNKTIDFVAKEAQLMGFYESLLEENGIGGKTANQIKNISFKKQEENFCNLLNTHKNDLNHEHDRIKDLAKYTILILENKQSEIINKIKNNQNIDKNKETDFLTHAIEGLLKI